MSISQKSTSRTKRRPSAIWKAACGRKARFARIAARSITRVALKACAPSRAKRTRKARSGMAFEVLLERVPQAVHGQGQNRFRGRPSAAAQDAAGRAICSALPRRASAPSTAAASWKPLQKRLVSWLTASAKRCGTACLAPMGGAGKIVESDETYIGRIKGQAGATWRLRRTRTRCLPLWSAAAAPAASISTAATVANIAPILRQNMRRESRLDDRRSQLLQGSRPRICEPRCGQARC